MKLTYVTAVFAITVLAMSMSVGAIDRLPNWLEGAPVHRQLHASGKVNDCKIETRTILGISPHV